MGTHRQLTDDTHEDTLGRGAGDNEAEQDQPCEAVHSTRLDEDLQKTMVPCSTAAQN